MAISSQTSTSGAVHASLTPWPGGRFLSNGRYHVLVTRSGTGCSTCGDHALTRWIPDPIEDRLGLAMWLRDLDDGEFVSIGLEPCGRPDGRVANRWEPGVVTLERDAMELEARLEVAVLATADAEVRRLVLVNRSARSRRIEVTTAAEVVLSPPAADATHPAFAKLFVQTEAVPERRALLARRRARGADESHPVLVHALLEPGAIAWETDRVRFAGRGRDRGAPEALRTGHALSGTVGNVLDPLVSLRRTLELAPGGTATLSFVLGCAPDRTAALALLEPLAEGRGVDAALAAAREHALAVQRSAGLDTPLAEGLHALASGMLVGLPALRPAAADAVPGAVGAALNGFAPLPGRPLVLVTGAAAAPAQLPAIAAARGYWLAHGVDAKVVVVTDGAAETPAGLHVVRAADLGAGVAALRAAASLVLEEPLAAAGPAALRAEAAGAPRPRSGACGVTAVPEPADEAVEDLRHFNGHGGFNAAGDEYVIRMPWEHGALRLPPLPWVNVIANPGFGFIASETGAGATWALNSREHRLSPWFNDPVLDPHGEALYLRDEESGAWWSPLPGPAPQPVAHEMRHGFGYSVARHAAGDLEQEVTLFAAMDAPVKVSRVRVTNRGALPRRLAFVSYQRLVLGGLPEETARFVRTRHDAGQGVLTATHPFAGEFAQRVAFAAAVAPRPLARSVTADRAAFLGPAGSPALPAALAAGGALDERCGAGLDPCFAEAIVLDVAPGGTVECAFLFGECASDAEVAALVARLRQPGAIEAALDEAVEYWRELVSGVQVATPSPEIDLMVNGWLAYQTLSCRIWGRTAFYQSGGAFGFRDQLQDAVSLVHLRPSLAREQILLHAAHQFVEGDVLHWWHPPLARGIRTRFADDLLWLPLLATTYAEHTGDWAVFDATARFLEAPMLAPGEDERYLVPRDSGRVAEVYEHCCRALDRSLAVGAHGLPLFGCGDWNDGMNRVGREGRGESVWMGFFLVAILDGFIPLCGRRGDQERATRYALVRDRLRAALEDAGWDGAWYRRAYYDDGAPMGSASSYECRIDGLAQAWAVISRAAPPERACAAMEAVLEQLVSERDGLIRLLTPAFQDTPHDPGYIKGYVAGVRENGGQYTHAALWVVRAFAELGRDDLAARLLAMLSPVWHTSDPETLAVYRTEPYVVVADVYGEPPHVGRGGWTWYTGSAGWMLRVAIESVLGLRLAGGSTLRIRPCTPPEWREFRADYRVPGGRSRYRITFRRTGEPVAGVVRCSLDGKPVGVQAGTAEVPFVDDGATHDVLVELGDQPSNGRSPGNAFQSQSRGM